MADMEWVRMTHQGYIKGMAEHANELEQENERHLYGVAINRITLLMEHIEALEAENKRLREVLRKAGGLAEYDNWPERYPKVYGLMAELEENNDE